MYRLSLCLALVLLCACQDDAVRKIILQSNPGLRTDFKRLARWTTPISVNTSGIARADEAVAQMEKAMGGAITFSKVQETPENGIVFIDGGGMNGDGSPGCGHVSGGSPGQLSVNFRTDDGEIKGTYYVHLGSTGCSDATRGQRRSAVAEHELAHALGLMTHFENFTGNEGISPDSVRSVLYNLYRNPIGAKAEELKIFPLPTP